MTLWHSPPSLEGINAIHRGSMGEHLDIAFTEISDSYLRATMPVDARTRQPFGLLHGGASVALAETVGSTAAGLCIDSAIYHCFGLEINANHVRAARTGRVTATARPKHIGGSTHVWTIDIVNEADQLICTSRLTMAIVKRAVPQAQS